MAKRDDRLLLQDMLDACQDIQDFLGNCTENAFLSDRMKQYAVIRAFEILGEAAGKLSQEIRDQNIGVPWKNIIGMRNILIHVYHEADLDLVWRTATVFVPELKSNLMKISDHT